MARISYKTWRKMLFEEIGCDEDLFVAAGEQYIRGLYDDYCYEFNPGIVDAADELIDSFAID